MWDRWLGQSKARILGIWDSGTEFFKNSHVRAHVKDFIWFSLSLCPIVLNLGKWSVPGYVPRFVPKMVSKTKRSPKFRRFDLGTEGFLGLSHSSS